MRNYFHISDINKSDAVSNGNTDGFVDGNTNPSVNDYAYDANANMISDKNKGITSITYNHLNLPVKINFSPTVNNDFTITYTYNALGQKLSKFVDSTPLDNKVKLVEYFDGFQYTGGQLNFFPTPEGYVNVTLGSTGNRIFIMYLITQIIWAMCDFPTPKTCGQAS